MAHPRAGSGSRHGGEPDPTAPRLSETDLDELLPLMRGYCDFYEVAPGDERMLEDPDVLAAEPSVLKNLRRLDFMMTSSR